MNVVDGMACAKPGCDNRGKPGLNIVGHGSFVTKSGRRRRHRCKVCGGTLSTNTGTGTVKLANNQLTDPQDIGLVPVVNTSCWASDRAVNLNLTIPARIMCCLGKLASILLAGNSLSTQIFRVAGVRSTPWKRNGQLLLTPIKNTILDRATACYHFRVLALRILRLEANGSMQTIAPQHSDRNKTCRQGGNFRRPQAVIRPPAHRVAGDTVSRPA